jgi:nucleoside-diphosphate-sugar epimerase
MMSGARTSFSNENQVTVMPFKGRDRYEFLHGDLADISIMDDALKGVTNVVILAGLVGDPITKTYPEASGAINNVGIQKLLTMFKGRGLNKVIFVSTCSNYGLIPDDRLADEAFDLNPLSLYAKAKVAGENCLLSLKDEVDYHGTVLRFATAFGLSPRMRFDLTVSEFTREIYLGRDLLVYDADTWRPYCHVQDFGEVIRRVLEAPVETVNFEVFNAGGSVNNFTKQMIIDGIMESLPDAPVRYQEHGSDPRNYRVDFEKIRNRLHFEPAFTVRDGIRELIESLRQNLFSRVETQPNFFGNYMIDYPVD